MPHIPRFPPQWSDFAPGNPFEGGLPLPNFLTNPWLTQEQFTQVEAESGYWAAKRAESMVPRTAGFETLRRAARSMIGPYLSRLPLLPEVPLEKKRVRKPKVGLAKEIAPLVGVLTPEQEEELADAVLEDIIDYKRRYRGMMPDIEGKMNLAKAVVDWAEDNYGATISEAKGIEIVDKAIARISERVRE